LGAAIEKRDGREWGIYRIQGRGRGQKKGEGDREGKREKGEKGERERR
jgi:hypothetical protein